MKAHQIETRLHRLVVAGRRHCDDPMATLPISAAVEATPQASDSEDKPSSPATHWRRQKATAPLSRDQAARQGGISTKAFQVLGKDAAIEFLNAEHIGLGGRPLALATQCAAGDALVKAELERLASAASSAPRVELPLEGHMKETKDGQGPKKI